MVHSADYRTGRNNRPSGALISRRAAGTILAGLFIRCGSAAQVANDTVDPLAERVDAGIRRAMSWLAGQQQPSGAWLISDSGESTAATSLAIMAFLAAGHVPEEGPYGRQLTRGVAWLLAQQRKNGLITAEEGFHGPMYSHGIATLMLAEVSGMLDDTQADRCREVLTAAVRLIVDAQNHPKPAEHEGGWRYEPTSAESDLSVTAWQLLALRAARDIGCDVPAENIDRAVAYVRRLHVVEDGGFGYIAPNGSTITRAGTGITALEVCGEHRTEETLAAAKLILASPLTIKEHYFFYGMYYCTVGMFKVGGDEWKQARETLYRTALELQNPDGYWLAEIGQEKSAGKVYATSMCVLALSIEYGYLPIYQR
jgi:hypothetical protein